MNNLDDWSVTNAYGDEPASEAVVRAVAAATDRNLLSLDPLYDAVDAEALDTLFDRGADATVRFTYEDCAVEVRDERVVVREVGST